MRAGATLTAVAMLLVGSALGYITGHVVGFSNAIDRFGTRFLESRLVEAGMSNAFYEAALDSDCARLAGATRTFVVNSAFAVAWLLPYLEEGFQRDRARRYLQDTLGLIDRDGGPHEQEMRTIEFVRGRLAEP